MIILLREGSLWWVSAVCVVVVDKPLLTYIKMLHMGYGVQFLGLLGFSG